MSDASSSLLAVALLIFAACAVIMLLRGLLRTILGIALFCISIWIGFVVWQRSPELAIQWTGKPMPWIVNGLPVAAGMVAFIIGRGIVSLIVRPFHGGGNPDQTFSLPRMLMRLTLLVIPTGILWLTGVTLVHHFGSIAEVSISDRPAADADGNLPPLSAKSWSDVPSVLLDGLARAAETISDAIPESWLGALDPVTTPARIALAKALTNESTPPPPSIDETTGRPIPRAIPVDERTLMELAEEVDPATLMRMPQFRQAAENPQTRRSFANGRQAN